MYFHLCHSSHHSAPPPTVTLAFPQSQELELERRQELLHEERARTAELERLLGRRQSRRRSVGSQTR